MDRLADKSTSNLAKMYNMIRTKMDGGKIKNLIQRGNFELRSKCAVLCFNQRPTWHYKIIKEENKELGFYTSKAIEQIENKHKRDRSRKSTNNY